MMLVMIIGFQAQAEWICETQTAVREGNNYKICGVGQDLIYESNARMYALKNAVSVFNQVCEMSSDCKKKNTIVVPGRTDCSSTHWGGWKCFMLLEIAVN